MNYQVVSEESLNKAAEIILNGGLVAFPTETVYGLGANAFNPHALAKVFEVKERPFFDPLIIHIASIDTLEKAADLSLLNEEKRKKLFLLAENLWPGPLSIILPKNENIPGIATAGLQTAAIRFPDYETAQKLISLSSGAIAAPSANPFGLLSPTRAEHVRQGLGEKVDLILDGGPTRIGLESTVLDITGECISILRFGGTPKEIIEKLIGSVHVAAGNEDVNAGLSSPGQLKSHYAPRTPLSLLNQEAIIEQPYKPGSAFLFFDASTRNEWLSKQNPPKMAVIKVLSGSAASLEASTLEAASCLFDNLHELDSSNIKHIFAQSAPPKGLGEAINDRLSRAAVGSAYQS